MKEQTENWKTQLKVTINFKSSDQQEKVLCICNKNRTLGLKEQVGGKILSSKKTEKES